ncbi:hypothetical protein KR018_005139 [Drosophila ironensis]|nr:hypothetical protein KR018_005139 [Drosophila ironensis]
MSDLEDPSSVTVALRVRPLVPSELDRNCQICVECARDGSPQVTVSRTRSYTYNHVFGIEDSQKYLFDSCVEGKLKKFMNGYHLTIMAYGQTGSGKTYTMGTAYNGSLDEDAGVIPRAVHEIFREIDRMSGEYRFQVSCSFVELYQEQFFDLLSGKPRDKSTVDIREMKNQIVMPGLTEVEVRSAQEVTEQLMRGSAGRAVAATAMNETSSRSHAIFTVTLVATKIKEPQSVTTSRFNLVDLAGSERCSKTLASGDRFKEGVNINKGLLALSNVISALGSGNPGYVRYRDSKLTRLLQDSLGGNSITLMIACVSPADYNVDETLTTLRYADQALQIKNKPVVNLDPHAAEVKKLKDIIQRLRDELVGGGKMSSSISTAINAVTLGAAPSSESLALSAAQAEENRRLKEEKRLLLERNRKLEQELHQSWADLTEKEMRLDIAEHGQEKLRNCVVQLKTMLEQQPQQNDGAGDGLSGDQLKQLNTLIDQANDELQRSQKELENHGLETRGQRLHSEREETSSSGGDDVHEMMQSQSEEFTNAQLNLAGELRNINRQLDLKKELHERIMLNFSRLEADGEDDKLRACHQKIEDLETERRELMDQLRSSKNKDTMAKLAEDRRKRLNSLEQEISDLRRKIVTQANMLKMREKEREKIQNLSSEIRVMKESKVKLIRAMRGESEKFRQWKIVREKELTQLKSKDRKLQSEMVRQQTLHDKQRQVLKRKCEEALATNKRLKEALERQATAQAQRQKYQKEHGSQASNSQAKTDSWVDRELEIILSLVDAERSLEQLMEDRAVITTQFQLLEKQTSINPADRDEQARMLASLSEELEMRNAQIADLEQVCQKDLDAQIRALAEGVQSVSESRTVSKHLLKTLIQQRRNLNERSSVVDEQRSQLNEAQQQHEAVSKLLRLTEAKYEEQMLCQQRNYEEKMEVLLRAAKEMVTAETAVTAAAEPAVVVSSSFEQGQATSGEALPEGPEKIAKKKKKNNAEEKSDIEEIADESIMSLNETMEISDNKDDPDWVPKIKRSTNFERRNTGTDKDASMPHDSVNGSINSKSITTTPPMEEGKPMHCKCRTRCNRKRCGCFGGNNGCHSGCVCKGNCLNPNNIKPMDMADANPSSSMQNENVVEGDEDLGKENFKSPENKPIIGGEESKNKQATNAGPQPLGNSNVDADESTAPKLARCV